MLARGGHSVLLLEQHYNLGGLATWFKRRGHIFDIALHGFPVGMIKTCRKYWTPEIASMIVQLKGIRFDNPQFSFTTTYDREDFTRILEQRFKIPRENVEGFFDTARNMNFYDDQGMTTREFFEKFFPGRDDVHRMLMESITYANGSTLDDPAITYVLSPMVICYQPSTNWSETRIFLKASLQRPKRYASITVAARSISASRKVIRLTTSGICFSPRRQ